MVFAGISGILRHSEMLHFLPGERFAEIIPLNHIAIEVFKFFILPLFFDAFRNKLHAKAVHHAYYVLNDGTDLYKSLSKQNKTRNIIPFKNNGDNNHLFQFLLNSKIIIQSYALYFFQKIASEVKYLKFLYICHAVNYFKTNIIKDQLLKLEKSKQNIILTSPYEYNLYKKLNLYDEKSMHKAGLARYDRLNNFQKNVSEKNCILMSFTYRGFNNSIYRNSLFKKNTP